MSILYFCCWKHQRQTLTRIKFIISMQIKAEEKKIMLRMHMAILSPINFLSEISIQENCSCSALLYYSQKKHSSTMCNNYFTSSHSSSSSSLCDCIVHIEVIKTYCCCEWFIRQSTQLGHTTFSSHTKKDYSKSLPASATVQNFQQKQQQQ